MDNKNNSLELNSFVCLLLATLASNSKLKDEQGNKTFCLPANYKQIIENILCEENGWKEEFSILIDMDNYFENHFRWEKNLSKTLIEVLDTLNKEVKYDFMSDGVLITFNKNEIDLIMNEINDKNVIDTMDHFANLLTAQIYSRRYQEEYHDYSAVAVKRMRDIKNGPKNKILKFFNKNY